MALSILYWNDAVDVERMLREGYLLAQDDYLTAALSVLVEPARKGYPVSYFAGLRTITLKDHGRRVDLFAAGMTVPLSWRGAGLDVTAGLMAQGNFGGAALQNGWHALRHHSIIDLPYLGSPTVGLYVSQRLSVPLLHMDRGQLQLLAVNEDAFQAHYHRLNLQLHGELELGPTLGFETTAGYTSYHHLHRDLALVFEDGISYGFALRCEVRPGVTVAPWLLANLYRNDQSVPGLSLVFGPASVRHVLSPGAAGP